jgi:hypothetical protein
MSVQRERENERKEFISNLGFRICFGFGIWDLEFPLTAVSSQRCQELSIV